VAGVGVVEVGALVASGLLRPDPEMPMAALVGFGVLLLLPVAAWGMYARARRELFASLHGRVQRVEAEQQLRVERAQAQERTRIAREMHDVLAHRISLVSMHAGAVEFRPDSSPEEIARAAGVIRASAHQALEDLRDILGVLRADSAPEPAQDGRLPSGRPQPTLTDLAELVEQARGAGAPVDLQVHVLPGADVPALAGRTAYRVVQEALTNARKHAAGHAVEVVVDGAAGQGLSVLVVDRPPAVPVPRTGARAEDVPGAGLGLVGLAERVALAGGALEHGPRGAGFELHARLPWPA